MAFVKLTVFLSLLAIALAGTNEKKLYDDLMKGYSKDVKPAETDKAVPVTYSIELVKLLSVDDSEGIVEARVWTHLGWTDDGLKWDPATYGGLKVIRLPSSKIWIPDLTMYKGLNSEDNAISIAKTEKYAAVAYSTGAILFIPIVDIKFRCNSSIAKFPEDKLSCYIKVGSWVYDGNKGIDPNFSDNNTNIGLSQLDMDYQWEVKATGGGRVNKKYPCCLEIYPFLYYNFELTRRSPEYLSQFFQCPASFLLILLVASFFMPFSTSARTITQLFAIAGYGMLSMKLSKYINPMVTNETPELMKYYCKGCMVALLSIILSAVASWFYHMSYTASAIPCLLKKVFVDILGCAFLCKKKNKFGSEEGKQMLNGDGQGQEDENKKYWRMAAYGFDRISFVVIVIIALIIYGSA